MDIFVGEAVGSRFTLSRVLKRKKSDPTTAQTLRDDTAPLAAEAAEMTPISPSAADPSGQNVSQDSEGSITTDV